MVESNYSDLISFICTVISKVKLATLVEGNSKPPFSIATTPWITPLYR